MRPLPSTLSRSRVLHSQRRERMVSPILSACLGQVSELTPGEDGIDVSSSVEVTIDGNPATTPFAGSAPDSRSESIQVVLPIESAGKSHSCSFAQWCYEQSCNHSNSITHKNYFGNSNPVEKGNENES